MGFHSNRFHNIYNIFGSLSFIKPAVLANTMVTLVILAKAWPVMFMTKTNQINRARSSENHDIRSFERNHWIVSDYKDEASSSSLTTTSYIMQKHHITFKFDHIVYPLWNVSEWTYGKISRTIWWLSDVHFINIETSPHVIRFRRAHVSQQHSRALIGLMMPSLDVLIRDLCLKFKSIAFWDLFGAAAFSL